MCSYASKCDPRTCCTPVPVTHSFYSTCSMLSTWWVFLEAHGIDNSNRSLARCKYNFCIILLIWILEPIWVHLNSSACL